MGTGKSSVGALVAERAGARFVDLDRAIEKEAGVGVGEIFAREGESGFRARERRLLELLLGRAPARPCVIALGGGALLDPALRSRALAGAFVVVLRARAATIAARTRGSDRPLLRDPAGPRAAIARLLAARTAGYAEAHVVLDTDGRSIARLAARVLAAWRGGRSWRT
jgi:shikimate kinase